MISLEIPAGWRLWHLGQRTTGEWGALLYNLSATRHGESGDAFSSNGRGSTPQGAINACLLGPTSERLFKTASYDESGLPVGLMEEAIAARGEATRLLKAATR